MYTTLETLKNGSACTEGYGRMLSFFTTKIQFKKIPIPIWMIGMIGEYEDMQWAINNAMIIDPQMYAEFRAKTILSMVKCLFWSHFNRSWETERNKPLQQAIKECMSLSTAEEAEAFLKKWEVYHFGHNMWNSVIESETLRKPHSYIYYVTENQSRTAHIKFRERHPSILGSDFYFPWAKGRTKRENFAMLCTGTDPHIAVLEMMDRTKVAASRGIALTSMQEGGQKKFMATINLSDPRKIFRIAHLLGAEEFDVLEATGVNDVLNQAASLVEDLGQAVDEDILRSVRALQAGTLATELMPPAMLQMMPCEKKSVVQKIDTSEGEGEDEEHSTPLSRMRARRARDRAAREAIQDEPEDATL